MYDYNGPSRWITSTDHARIGKCADRKGRSNNECFCPRNHSGDDGVTVLLGQKGLFLHTNDLVLAMS